MIADALSIEAMSARVDELNRLIASLVDERRALAGKLICRLNLRSAAKANTLEDQAAAAVAASAAVFGVSPAEIRSRSRAQPAAFARQAAMTIAAEASGATLVEVGLVFGGRDHGTVSHARDAVSRRCETDPKIAQKIAQMRLLNSYDHR